MAHDAPRPTDELIDKIERDPNVGAHRQSIYRRMLGLPVRGRVATRIDRALEAHGFALSESTSANEAG